MRAVAEADARTALQVMAPDEPVASAQLRGDPSLAGPTLPGRRFADVTRAFGYAFASALDGVAPGAWRGPLASPLGWHLVRVTGRDGGGAQPLAAVRGEAIGGGGEAPRHPERAVALLARFEAPEGQRVRGGLACEEEERVVRRYAVAP